MDPTVFVIPRDRFSCHFEILAKEDRPFSNFEGSVNKTNQNFDKEQPQVMSGLDLELSNGTGSAFVDLASSATNFIQDYVLGLPSGPISSSHDLKYPNADELHALAQPLEAKGTINERGTNMQEILAHLGQVMQTGVTKSSHSGHVAFINGYVTGQGSDQKI